MDGKLHEIEVLKTVRRQNEVCLEIIFRSLLTVILFFLCGMSTKSHFAGF